MSGYTVSAPMGFGFGFDTPVDLEPSDPPRTEPAKDNSKNTSKNSKKSLKSKPTRLKKLLRFNVKGSTPTKASSQIPNQGEGIFDVRGLALTQTHSNGQVSAADRSVDHIRRSKPATDDDPFFTFLSPEVQAVCSSMSVMMNEVSVFKRNLPAAFSSLSPDHSDISSDFETSDNLEDTSLQSQSMSALSVRYSPNSNMCETDSISEEDLESVDPAPLQISADAQGLFVSLSSSHQTEPLPTRTVRPLSVSRRPPLLTSMSTSKIRSATGLFRREDSNSPKRSASGIYLPNLIPQSMPEDIIKISAERQTIRQNFEALPQDQETRRSCLNLFTGVDSIHNTLRRSESLSFSICDIDGITFEKLIFHSTSSPDTSALLIVESTPTSELAKLSNLFQTLTGIDIILTSYRNICSPERLFAYVSLLSEIPTCRSQLKNLFRLWVTTFTHDFNTKPALLQRIYDLLLQVFMGQTDDGDTLVLIQQVTESMRACFNRPMATQLDSSSKFTSWNSLPPKLLGEGITHLDLSVFKSIQPDELLSWPLLSKEEKPSCAPSLFAMVNQFNYWHYFIATHVLRFREVEKRSEALMSSIALALALKKLNNISGLTAVLSALNSTPVVKLKQTWALVQPKYLKVYSKLKDFISSQYNFGRIRNHTLESALPGIPYLGVVMQDMTFIHENSDFLKYHSSLTDLVNCKKAVLVTKAIVTLRYFQRSMYRQSPAITDETLKLLRAHPVLKPEQLQKLSEKLEPTQPRKDL